MLEEITSPPIASAPTDQHAQNMWVLGVMSERLNSIDKTLTLTLEEKRIQNGRIAKTENEIITIKQMLAENKGQREAFRMSWSTTFIIITVIVSAVGLILKFVKAF